MLSKHGPFSSKPIHQNASVGSLENMESVAEEVRKCIIQGSFGGKQLLCYRGIKQDEYIFDDEKEESDDGREIDLETLKRPTPLPD